MSMSARVRRSGLVAVAVRIGVLLGAGVLGWGCGQVPATPSSQSEVLQLLETKGDTGVALRAAVVRDTVAAGESAPVHVVYAIANGPRPTDFDNHPERFRFLVTGPDGELAESLGGAPAASGGMGATKMVLPARSFLVQRQDLRCVNDLAYSAVPVSRSERMCRVMYSLATPGEYRVIVEYFGPEPDSILTAIARGEIRDLSSLPPTLGIHLADTTTFVVVGR